MQQKTNQFTYTEFWRARTGLSFGIERVLFDQHSDYQRVQVLETDAVGRLLLLDGLVMVTEWDEYVYHEMISHPALCVIPDPKRVLIIGGGDGGTAREVLRHESIEHVDLVEIDQMVLDVAREFFPDTCAGFQDPRLAVHVGDGVAFAAGAEADQYDLVIVDSTDPVDFAEALFGEAFYRDCARILRDHGMLVTQSESPFDPVFGDTVRRAYADLSSILEHVRVYLAHIPTYPTGTWSFNVASRRTDIVKDFDLRDARRRVAPFQDALSYYTPDLHLSAFALPAFVGRMFA